MEERRIFEAKVKMCFAKYQIDGILDPKRGSLAKIAYSGQLEQQRQSFSTLDEFMTWASGVHT